MVRIVSLRASYLLRCFFSLSCMRAGGRACCNGNYTPSISRGSLDPESNTDVPRFSVWFVRISPLWFVSSIQIYVQRTILNRAMRSLFFSRSKGIVLITNGVYCVIASIPTPIVKEFELTLLHIQSRLPIVRIITPCIRSKKHFSHPAFTILFSRIMSLPLSDTRQHQFVGIP